jgi:hypothetical protein
MKKLQKTTFILFIIILISSCDNKTSELDFEKNVMLEIYPNLIDSLWIYNSISNSVSFVKLDKNNKVIGVEPKDENKLKKECNKQLAEIKKDTSRIFIVILDTISRIQPFERNELKNYYKNVVFYQNKELDTLEYSVDRKKISSIKHLKVKYIPKFKMDERVWETKHAYSFWGVVSFSRIQFDTEKKYGILTSSVICGGLCGHGYRFFIKKVKDKWIIDKVEEAWIS